METGILKNKLSAMSVIKQEAVEHSRSRDKLVLNSINIDKTAIVNNWITDELNRFEANVTKNEAADLSAKS